MFFVVLSVGHSYSTSMILLMFHYLINAINETSSSSVR
jgi:hypothetical protein